MAIRIRTQRRWRKVIEAQEASGLGVGEYCSKENICQTSFYAWRKRIGLMPGEPISALLPEAGGERPVSGDEPKGFMQVVPPGEEASRVMRIELPNGYGVVMDCKGQDLKQLLELLRCM